MPRILQPRWKLYAQHHERLALRPDPLAAERKFLRRLDSSRRVGMVRGAFFGGLYFSAIAAALGFVLDSFNVAAQPLLDLLRTLFSSLTVFFLLGIFVCTRYLGHYEVDLAFYSAESRMGPD